MRILGIETSCDETAVSVVRARGQRLIVEKNLVFSQVDDFAELGGVVPEVAARLHLEKIMPLVEHAVGSSGKGVDVIAVTRGPGLAPALRTGVEVAKTLAFLWRKPLVPVSHMEGHIAGAWLQTKRGFRTLLTHQQIPKLPALCLLVSGGHTELVLMEAPTVFKRLGDTIDDAAGEAFDKVGKMLGLAYPGGPKIDKMAYQGNASAFDFPRGLVDKDNFDFSFSGLKTSVLYTLREHEDLLDNDQFRADIAASFAEAVVDALARKTEKAILSVHPKSVIVAGGVSASSHLRSRFERMVKQKYGIPLFFPEFAYSLDNAAMIAGAGYFRFKKYGGVDPLSLKADPNEDLCYA